MVENVDKASSSSKIFIVSGVSFLVVFAGSLAVLNPLELGTKVLVPRTKSDLQGLEMGFRQYFIDWGRFPTPEVTDGEGYIPQALTSPIPYLHHLPSDSYSKDEKRTFRYEVTSTTSEETAIVLSLGPDRMISFPFEDLGKSSKQPFESWLYAPTNGVKSSGDIFRIVSEGRVDQEAASESEPED